jgi:hypothetical protein
LELSHFKRMYVAVERKSVGLHEAAMRPTLASPSESWRLAEAGGIADAGIAGG